MPQNSPPTPIKAPSAHVELADPGQRLCAEPTAWLLSRLDAALKHLGTPGTVRIRLVGDTEMAEAHVRFSGVEGTTDVLTFDLRTNPDGPLETELLLCVDEARRQAAAMAHPIERELLLYALHGVLHCLGENDHDDDAFARMHAREDAVLSAIGVGPTFVPPSKANPASTPRPAREESRT